MKNPYRCKGKGIRITIDPSLAKIIIQYKNMIQKDCDNRFGKNKFKVSKQFSSKKIAEVLR